MFDERKSTDRVRLSRNRKKLSGGGRIDAQVSASTLNSLNDIVNRTGMKKSEVVEAAIALLFESMESGLIMHSKLDLHS
jgi:hypothetical protein